MKRVRKSLERAARIGMSCLVAIALLFVAPETKVHRGEAAGNVAGDEAVRQRHPAAAAMEELEPMPANAAIKPVRKDRAYFEERGDIVWEVPSAGKRIALTFDDGPDPKNTPAILELLKQHDAKATFFLVGWRVKDNPELVKRTVREGHEVGNHSYYHKYFRRGISAAEIKEDMMKAHRVIKEVTGTAPHLYRPPGGYYNQQLVDVARANDYRIVMWSWHQDTKDWSSPGVQRIVNKVLNSARNGDIVLMHDFAEGRAQTVEALKQILPELKKRGYSIVTVSELMSHRVKGELKTPRK
ncbi:polysaccharide deacetylase family protein [Paenibacillus thiaminolyticus]|uniref:Polysaccharide deacetylase family protein n=1 Tax=Paenibacillus thiaminolyticus TaxID=49283 RepID=A0A3A3GEA8_PANTH|nr:polysaccharide deacetylase family protein [Paenibacillus thiaminolyticus]RJG21013.1 polysaccharide deacetylase family protein [Paenibacillus thiaminolyticus]RJG21501.1 polysaccharide deacetylase family protein [Paenibacillus thiaminolyticus]